MVGDTGLEPVTSCMSSKHSNSISTQISGLNNDENTACTDSCTSSGGSVRGKDLEQLARVLAELTRSEWMTLMALVQGLENAEDENRKG